MPNVSPPGPGDYARDLAADLAAIEGLGDVSLVQQPWWELALRQWLPAAVRRALHAEAAIRRHRDYRGDDRCHLDDGELYAALPEGDTRPAREVAVTIENCHKYVECRQHGREYVSPQRRIEELELEAAQLRTIIDGLAARVAAQSELLSRRAEGVP